MKYKKVILGIAALSGLFFSNLQGNSVHADNVEGLTGTWSGVKNNLDILSSLDGDILFGYRNGCEYGKFTHTAIVYRGSHVVDSKHWDGPIVESTSGHGSNSVLLTSLQSNFYNYDAASLTYFKNSSYKFNGTTVANNAAHAYRGDYNVYSAYSANGEWYCSKLVSRAVSDYNGYKVGWTAHALVTFILPEDVWYDSALGQRSYSVSTKYDGNSIWNKASSTTLSLASDGAVTNNSVVNNVSDVKETKYKGFKVYSNHFDIEAKKLVDERIKEEQEAGKISADNTIVLSDAKPGLDDYLRKLLKEGATKEDIKAKWHLSDTELEKL
jgi:hypothetical protein